MILVVYTGVGFFLFKASYDPPQYKVCNRLLGVPTPLPAHADLAPARRGAVPPLVDHAMIFLRDFPSVLLLLCFLPCFLRDSHVTLTLPLPTHSRRSALTSCPPLCRRLSSRSSCGFSSLDTAALPS